MKNETNENPALSKMAVSKSAFYCQNACGEENFLIDEWNKVFDEVKDKSEEIQRLVLDNPECENQCFDCCAIVGKRQKETKELIFPHSPFHPFKKYSAGCTKKGAGLYILFLFFLYFFKDSP